MSELALNIIGVGLVYSIIGAIIFVVVKVAIFFAKRGGSEKKL